MFVWLLHREHWELDLMGEDSVQIPATDPPTQYCLDFEDTHAKMGDPLLQIEHMCS